MTAAPGSIPRQDVAEFAGFGIGAFTTTRDAGTFSFSGPDPVGEVMARWTGLQEELSAQARRMVIGRQVQGSNVLTHRGGWEGLLRTGEADGHLAAERGIVLTVSVADCVPIFIAHPSGIVALLHSGWRGTVARIIDAGISAYARLGMPPDELKVHLGPAICGRCYEVSAEVRAQFTGQPVNRPGKVDIRSLIAEHAREIGVTDVSVSSDCTRCDNDRYFSHRAGDTGRQLGVIVAGLW
ncbi:MAG: polyphenol oxidase family protein [Gemmatimonadaceae bacterium]|nr:polyphenol oxidase family protein [Gemmatimonadaceae bacterium]